MLKITYYDCIHGDYMDTKKTVKTTIKKSRSKEEFLNNIAKKIAMHNNLNYSYIDNIKQIEFCNYTLSESEIGKIKDKIKLFDDVIYEYKVRKKTDENIIFELI